MAEKSFQERLETINIDRKYYRANKEMWRRRRRGWCVSGDVLDAGARRFEARSEDGSAKCVDSHGAREHVRAESGRIRWDSDGCTQNSTVEKWLHSQVSAQTWLLARARIERAKLWRISKENCTLNAKVWRHKPKRSCSHIHWLVCLKGRFKSHTLAT